MMKLQVQEINNNSHKIIEASLMPSPFMSVLLQGQLIEALPYQAIVAILVDES